MYGKLPPDSSISWRDSLEHLCSLSTRWCWMQKITLNRMVLFSKRFIGQKSFSQRQSLISGNPTPSPSPSRNSFFLWLSCVSCPINRFESRIIRFSVKFCIQNNLLELQHRCSSESRANILESGGNFPDVKCKR